MHRASLFNRLPYRRGDRLNTRDLSLCDARHVIIASKQSAILQIRND